MPSVKDVFADFEFTKENCPGWTQEQIEAANIRNERPFDNEERQSEKRGQHPKA